MPAVRVGFRHPLVVGNPLVLPLLVETAKLFVRGVFDAFPLLHQPSQILVPVLACVTPHDRLHGRVGLQGRGIDRHRFAWQHLLLGGQRQHPLEHGRVRLQRQTITDAGQARMVGRVLHERDAEKLTQRKAVGTAPRDAALRADALVIADQQHAKVNSRRNGWPAEMSVIVRLAHFLDRAIEVRLRQQPAEFPVEYVSYRFRRTRGRHPHFLLFLSMFSRRHRHRLLRHAVATSYSCSEFTSRTISTGC